MRGEHVGGFGAVRLGRRLIPACAGSTRVRLGVWRWGRAHPRMRGEHIVAARMASWAVGSSPHARGAHRWHLLVGGGGRLIPACAGSTGVPLDPWCPVRAHPRMRGEHCFPDCTTHRPRGSSPHARGAPVRGRLHGPVQRLIPACAGSTRPRPSASSAASAHPRMRGEHCVRVRDESGVGGSSPHARGARHRQDGRCDQGGLIPACAGSTLIVVSGDWPSGAHPRMRGEHPGHGRHGCCGRRLIPACAGSTAYREAAGVAKTAHPRMRGEHAMDPAAGTLEGGSSPHARGARVVVLRHPLDHGLIPACAGSTLSSMNPCASLTAHPRMRGEHSRRVAGETSNRGSSPHARGAPAGPRRPHRTVRLIPACAGSTCSPRTR